MAISGLPRPLPECRCGAPLPRAVWRLRHACAACATPVERMAAAHTAAHLDRLAAEGPATVTRRVDARIDELAARRARRAAPHA